MHPRWEIRGLDFRRDGVWRARARVVRENRARFLSLGQFGALAAPKGIAPMAAGSATAVSGVVKVPAVLLRFKDSPPAQFTTADYNAVLFATTPPGNRPYTYRSFYAEMSNGAIDIQGTTYGYANLDSNEVFYTGGTSASCAGGNPYGVPNCNGLFSGLASSRMQGGLSEALRKLDAAINFAQYADTSGFVPLVVFIQEAMDGACGPGSAPENHLWAHRWSLFSTFTTQDNDPYHQGQKVKISDYILQSGQGGESACDRGEIMPIGTIAHETGHGFGLPDLYDTGGLTEAIGEWSLMAAGPYTSGTSPAHMDAWSLNQLGWVTVQPLTTDGTYAFDATALAHGIFYVPVRGNNPRGEYFLLENRQKQLADTAMIAYHCRRVGNPPGCGGGLLVWHIDSLKIAGSMFNNSVNSGAIHGVALVQADGYRNLDINPSNACPSNSSTNGCSNRGDAGDPYPGTQNNPALVFRTNPRALKNVDATFAGFGIDQIQQVTTNNRMSFRLRFGDITVARAADSSAVIQFNGATYNVFRDFLEQGTTYRVDFPDPQVVGRTRFQFKDWSDGGAASHDYVGVANGELLVANVNRDFKLIATWGSGGAVQADTTGVDIRAGVFIPQGRAVTLTATPDTGVTFGGWCGDTITANPTVALPMQRPYTVSAVFGPFVLTAAPARPAGFVGAAYVDTLATTGGSCAKNWAVIAGALPQGLVLGAQSGVVSGFPRQTGDFSFTVRVTDGPQMQSKAFTLSVTAPTLALADVLAHMLGPATPPTLNLDQLRYLDFIGNNNSSFDVGDFLAWLKATGTTMTPAMLRALQGKGGRP